MVDKAIFVQRHASEAIDSGDEFWSQLTQAKDNYDNYDNFDQTIVNLEVSQIEDHINQAPQPTNHYGAVSQETRYQCFTPLSCN